MAQKLIPWNTGGGNIVVNYSGSGNDTVTVGSDTDNAAFTPRSQSITVRTTAGASISRTVTVTQSGKVVPVGTIYNFAYTGTVQEVTLSAGTYKLQVWGAQGGSNPSDTTYGIASYDGGKGGYSEGILTLTSPTTLYIFVGGQPSTNSNNGGWNGGGGGSGTSTNGGATDTYGLGVSKVGRGGGATDIALTTSTMNYDEYYITHRNSASLLSRFIVAGGGSGGAACLKRITTSTSHSQVIVEADTILASTGVSSTMTISSNKWYDNGVNGSWGSTIFDVSSYKGKSCNLTVSSSTSYVFIKSLPVAGASVDYATGYTGYNSGAGITRNIPSDANYLSLITKANGNTRTPSDITILSEENTDWVINGSTKWESATGNNYKSLLIDVSSYRGKTCSFTLSASTNYAFVTSAPVAGQTPSWASGTTGQTWASSVNKVVPSDATYLYIYINNNGSVRIPSDITISWSESTTTDTYDSQVGYAGGGLQGEGYVTGSSDFAGKQGSAGSGGGGFGYGAPQPGTSYRYIGAGGGGGWYGGGNGYGNATPYTNGIHFSGAGSGFVNIAANAQYRPTGYTGLELDSGATYDGETSFPSTSGSTETGHSGDGYARITCIDPNTLIPLTFDILSNGKIGWKASDGNNTRTIQYKLNNGSWTSITSATTAPTIDVVAGDVVQFRGDNASYGASGYYNYFTTTCNYNIRGNIMSLISSTGYKELKTISSTYTFRSIFYAAKVIDASQLALPATTLANYCYQYMFYNSTTITTPPKLNVATTLSTGCYRGMFNSCINLESAPELPAATVPTYAYYRMFYNCAKISHIKCFATSVSASSCTTDWVYGVAASGTFVKKSAMSSWTTGTSGIPSGWTVVSR